MAESPSPDGAGPVDEPGAFPRGPASDFLTVFAQARFTGAASAAEDLCYSCGRPMDRGEPSRWCCPKCLLTRPIWTGMEEAGAADGADSPPHPGGPTQA